MSTPTHTPFGFNPFSTPRTPKGYAPLSSPSPSSSFSPDAEPVSPLARFNRTRGGKETRKLGELPSLRVWKETCKAFHINTSETPSSIPSTTSKRNNTKKNNTNKSKPKQPPPTTATKKPYPLAYGSFDRAMLLEDRDVFSLGAGDEEGEFGDSFNVYATKRRGGGGMKTK